MAGISAPLQLFGDFGFSGGEDVAPNQLQNRQICINYYAEVNKQNAKETVGLLACPGLVQLVFAPGGGVPVVSSGGAGGTTLRQIFETSMSSPTWTTGANFYSSSTINTPVILGINSTQVTVIDRQWNGSSAANSAGDGLVYSYSAATGALMGTNSQASASLPLKNWVNGAFNYTAFIIDHTGASSQTRTAVMPTIDGNYVLQGGNDTLVLNSNFPASPAFVAQIWSVLLALSGWSGASFHQVFPCVDFSHILVIALSFTGPHLWAVVNVTGGAATVTNNGVVNNSPDPVGSAFGNIVPGGGNDTMNLNLPAGSGSGSLTGVLGCLQSDLKTIWLAGAYRLQGQILVLQIQGTNIVNIAGQTGSNPSWAGTQAFPVSNACNPGNTPFGLWADNGICAIQAGQELTVWTINAPGGGIVQWPQASAVTNLPVRGTWELPNDNTALAVIGNTCFLVKVVTPATAFAFATLSLTSVGTLLTNIGPVHIRDNNVGGFAVIVDGPYGYLYNISTQAFAQITDPAFLGADTVAFIDGWWVFNQPGTQVFYTNFPQYGTGFNGSYFALKDGATDNLRAVFENKEQLWLLGDKTTEVWYDAGGQYFAFQRLVGTMLQFGCKAKHSPARFNTDGQDGIIWFGRSERGENLILRSRGFSVDVVSTPAFSNEVARYPITSDAIGYTYQEDTHEFYMLIFPTADTTWCYDSQSGLLHKRLSYDPYLRQFHRHRSNCFMNFQGMRIVGDYQCGSLFQLTRNVQTDAGWPLLGKRRSPHIWDKGQRGRVFMASLQIDFRQGVGNANGLGTNPQAGLSISRDGGTTFGQRWNAPIGQIGQYRNRTMWRKLAFGRDNVVDLEVIDPVPRDIIGVTLKAFSA